MLERRVAKWHAYYEILSLENSRDPLFKSTRPRGAGPEVFLGGFMTDVLNESVPYGWLLLLRV